MSGQFIGIDTSCYTTSAACVSTDCKSVDCKSVDCESVDYESMDRGGEWEGSIVSDRRTVLSVAQGERGLRQSDGVFQHVRNLSSLVPAVMADARREAIRAVGVSARPRPEEGSYMPVFLAGKAAAVALAEGLGVELMEFSHQEGHVRAALVGNEGLMDKPFLGMHLSGGTTEIFTVEPGLKITLLGGTDDLHAGQLVDRAGVAMGLPFPCGKHMEALASGFRGALTLKLPSSVRGLTCSFSGTESAVQRALAAQTANANSAHAESAYAETAFAETAYAVYDAMARTFVKLLLSARERTGLEVALLAGGVASSGLLRAMLLERMQKRGGMRLYFGASALSSDNAVGAALLARDCWQRGREC